MKTKLTNLTGCRRLIEIEIATEEVEREFVEVYKKIKKIAEVPGYRVGKAPQDVIEKRYKSTAEEEVLKNIIATSYEDAIKELKIAPVELPQISNLKLERGKPLVYKAEVDIRPEIRLKRYKGLKINKNKEEIKDADVEKALSDLQQLHAKFISADEQSTKDEDYVVCDMKCLSDGKELFNKENMWLLVDKEGSIKELYDGMISMKKDEEKEILAKLPKDYPNKELAEKDVIYKIKIKHIKEKKLPSLDDAFAKDLGKSNIQELKDAVRKDLEKRAEIAVNQSMRNQIIDQLLKNSSLEVPESMTNRQLENLVNDAKTRMASQGLKEPEVESNTKGIQERLRPQAINQVKAFFLLNEIALLENIKVASSEIDKAIEVMAARFKKDKKKLVEECEEKNLLQHIIEQIREEKTIEFLLKEADIIEK